MKDGRLKPGTWERSSVYWNVGKRPGGHTSAWQWTSILSRFPNTEKWPVWAAGRPAELALSSPHNTYGCGCPPLLPSFQYGNQIFFSIVCTHSLKKRLLFRISHVWKCFGHLKSWEPLLAVPFPGWPGGVPELACLCVPTFLGDHILSQVASPGSRTGFLPGALGPRWRQASFLPGSLSPARSWACTEPEPGCLWEQERLH